MEKFFRLCIGHLHCLELVLGVEGFLRFGYCGIVMLEGVEVGL